MFLIRVTTHMAVLRITIRLLEHFHLIFIKYLSLRQGHTAMTRYTNSLFSKCSQSNPIDVVSKPEH